MRKSSATNVFQNGMIMDFNPLVTPSGVTTGCLNGTLVTMNGNENVLLNDMGNGRVETAFLPKGYVPLGTTELGGIIYIVSYNPFKKKCLIGSFPSPERNITTDEIGSISGENHNVTFKNSDFIEESGSFNAYMPRVKTPLLKGKLSDIVLHPGDKFLVCGNSVKENISTISSYDLSGNFIRKYIDFRLATVDNNGRLIYLEDLHKYWIEKKEIDGKIFNGYINILEGEVSSESGSDIDKYRKAIGSDYHIFTSKVAGELYIVGKLETIDYISSVTWRVKSIKDNNDSDSASNIYTIEFTVDYVSEDNNKPCGFIFYCKDLIENNASPLNENNTYEVDFNIPIGTESLKTISVVPYMEFGKLEYLEEKVNIDFNLIGSNKIENKIWKYYKDNDSISIKFDLNNYYNDKDIKSVTFNFWDLEPNAKAKEDGKTYEFSEPDTFYNVPAKASYSGVNTITIPFDDKLLPDKLYKVVILCKLTDGSTDDKINHYLYTNGVFNNYISELDDSYDNFDDVELPLTPSIELEGVKSIPLSSTNELLSSDFVYVKEPNPNTIEGRTVYTAKGEKTVKVFIGLENNYNTFSLSGLNPTLSLDDSSTEGKVVIDGNIIQVPSNQDASYDSNYVNLYKNNNISTTEESNDDSKEHLIIRLIQDTITHEYTLSYNIRLISPIASNTVLRGSAVDDYYSPLLSTLSDLEKYDLVKEAIYEPAPDGSGDYIEKESYIVINTYGTGLGMSAGGDDNNGGGGLYYVLGDTKMRVAGSLDDDAGDYNGFKDLSINKIYIKSSVDQNDFSKGEGKPGISSFPNNDVSKYIVETKPNSNFVVIYLQNAGSSMFKYANSKYYFNGSGGYDGKDHARVDWMEEKKAVPYFVSAILFVKVKGTENYIPINLFFRIKGKELNNTTVRGVTEYYSMLFNLYAKRPYEGLVTVYTVGDFCYYDKSVNVSYNIKANTKYKSNDLHYNSISLVNYTYGENSPKCFSIKGISDKEVESTIDSVLDLTFDVKNKLVEEFTKYSLSPSIPAYVRTLEGEDAIAPAAPSSISVSNLYYSKNNKLTPVSRNIDLRKVQSYKLNESDNDTYFEVKFGANTELYSNLDKYIYDSREDSMAISQSYANSSKTSFYWGSYKPNYGSPTSISNNYLCLRLTAPYVLPTDEKATTFKYTNHV